MLIGRRINGRYKLLEMIGGGGMANVYLAEDIILEREVALKILRMDFNNDEEFIKRFNREAQSATSLAHSNIVSIYDVGEENDIYYIVMEYVKGLTLKQYIQKFNPVPIEKALDIMKQITQAISHAHHNGIIHRDIKPQNILIDDDGNVKITDFGIAMALSATSITQTNAVLGSVHYLSPEQARGGMANKKSDIYSLGIVMFELMTGRLPFSGESAVSIALKHLQSDTPSPKRWNPDIPQSVENIILKATAKDSFHRYESVDEMYEDIRTALDPERLQERAFFIPEDNDATKAIPVITDEHISEFDETIIRGHEKPTIHADKKQSNKTNKEPKKKGKKKRNKLMVVLVTIFSFLILLGILAFTVFPDLFGPKDVTVPSLAGEEYDDAISKLLNAGFEIGETTELEDEEIPADHVIRTSPSEGKVVKEGTLVDIYKSTGKKKIELTDYEGSSLEDVMEIVEPMNFKDIDTDEEFDESEAGTILEQRPSAGTSVIPSETILEFTVSKGPDKISLKDLRQYNNTGLEDYEREQGIKINISERYDDTIAEGLVISQSPKAGSKIDKGSTVNVVVSKGKEVIPPKVVSKDITIEYDEEMLGQPQNITIYIDDMTHNMTDPYKTFTITETVQETIEFTLEHNKKGGFKVIRDNSVIQEEEVLYPGG